MRSDAKDPRKPSPWEYLIAFLVMGMLVVWAMFSATSCSTTKYIDRWHTEYRDTTIYQKQIRQLCLLRPFLQLFRLFCLRFRPHVRHQSLPQASSCLPSPGHGWHNTSGRTL